MTRQYEVRLLGGDGEISVESSCACFPPSLTGFSILVSDGVLLWGQANTWGEILGSCDASGQCNRLCVLYSLASGIYPSRQAVYHALALVTLLQEANDVRRGKIRHQLRSTQVCGHGSLTVVAVIRLVCNRLLSQFLARLMQGARKATTTAAFFEAQC